MRSAGLEARPAGRSEGRPRIGSLDTPGGCVRHEEVVHYGEQPLMRLCQQLNLGYTPRMLEFNKSSEAVQTAQLSPLWTYQSSWLSISWVAVSCSLGIGSSSPRSRSPQQRRWCCSDMSLCTATRTKELTTAELSRFAQADEVLRHVPRPRWIRQARPSSGVGCLPPRPQARHVVMTKRWGPICAVDEALTCDI